jgi:hypothetical protein
MRDNQMAIKKKNLPCDNGTKSITPKLRSPILSLPLMNKRVVGYLQGLNVPLTVDCVATRYNRRYLQSLINKTTINESEKQQRSQRTTRNPRNGQNKIPLPIENKKYKLDDTSFGFSWWYNDSIQDQQMTQKQHNTACKKFVNGFNGSIDLTEIAGPNLAYVFVVPFNIQFGLMSAFKTDPNQSLVRERMKELGSLKSCFYTQLHWKKGVGRSSHINESDWRDNPVMDPTSSWILEGYMNCLSDKIQSKVGGEVKYTSLCSLIETERAGHQAAHIDDKGCTEKEECNRPFILHHPLCEEGSTLQVWLPNKMGSYSPTFVHIPFGSAMILRGDVYHAGCYGSRGNIRFHAHLTPIISTGDGRELGILNVNCDERLRETDLRSCTVNNMMLTKSHARLKFTSKYIKRMKQQMPVETFWVQDPEKNVGDPPKRIQFS